DEGYCTYMGGSGERSLDELLVFAKQYLDDHPDADTLDLFRNDFQMDGDRAMVYTLSGLFMRMIERQHGMEGIKRMITTPNDPDTYFGLLNELLGINLTNFDEKIR